MKIIDWFNAARLSFLVSQNIQRLIFLRDRLNERWADHGCDAAQDATIGTYRKTVTHFLISPTRLGNNVWPLDEVRRLYDESALLVSIGERLLYGDFESAVVPAEAEG